MSMCPADDLELIRRSNLVWHCDRAGLDLTGNLVDLGLDVGRDVDVALGETNAVVCQSERRNAGFEAAVGDALDRIKGGGVNTLDGTGNHRGRDRALIGVNADTVNTLVLGGGQHTQAAAARHLEDYVGTLSDLGIGLV